MTSQEEVKRTFQNAGVTTAAVDNGSVLGDVNSSRGGLGGGRGA